MADQLISDNSDSVQHFKSKISRLKTFYQTRFESLKVFTNSLDTKKGISNINSINEISNIKDFLANFIADMENQKNEVEENYEDILNTFQTSLHERNILKIKYQTLFEKNTDAIIIIDYNGKYLSFNPIAANSIKINNLTALTLWDLQEKEIADIKHELIQDCITKNKKIVRELDFRGQSRQYFFQPVGDSKTCMMIVFSSKKRIEDYLFKIENFLNESQRVTNIGSWEWNLKTNENIWSDHLFKIYGLDQNTTQPKIENFIKIVHPGDLDLIKTKSENGLKTKIPQSFIFRIIKPDGEIRFIEAHEEVFFNKNGVPVKVIGTNQDISEKILIETKLLEQQKLLLNAEKISLMGSWSWDIKNNLITRSENLYHLYEINPKIQNESFEDFIQLIHPEDVDLTKNAITDILLNKKGNSWNFRIKNSLNKIFNTNVNIQLNNNGEIELLYGTVQDITEKKSIEELLLKSEKSLKESQRIAQLGSWQYNIKTGQITGSEENFNIFGLPYNPEPANIEDFFSFIHEDDRENVSIAINEAVQNKSKYNIDHRILRPSGEVRYVNEQAEIIYDKNGYPELMIGTVLDITERKLTELTIIDLLRESQSLNEELVVSEEQVRESLDKSLQLNEILKSKEFELAEAQKIAKLGRWEYDLTTYKIYWSDEIFNIMGINPEVGTPDFENYFNMIHPDDREIFNKAVYDAVNDGIEYSIEIRMYKTDGSLIWTMGKGIAVRDDEGKIIKLIGINVDISDRKFPEIALKESEELFKALIQNSSDYVQLIDQEGHIIYESPVVENILGYQKMELVNSNFLDFVHPDDLSIAKASLQEVVINPNESSRVEIRLKDISGNWVWIDSVKTNLLSEQAVNSIVVNNRSISERKKAEEELLESEKKYRTLMESASDGIFLCDRDGYYTSANTTACHMMGYSKEELLKLNVKDLLTKEELINTPIKFEELYRGDTVISEREFLRKDRTVFTGEISAKMLENNVLQSFVRDISERKKAEVLLQNQNTELIKINAELDKFVYRASHDLRAPLASVLGLINIAKIEVDETLKDSYYDLMEKSINKLDGFIKSIINFSRNSRVEYFAEKIEFNDIINDSFDDLKYLQSGHNVNTEILISEGEFYSDLFRIKLIFNNIISNAFRYSVPMRERAFLNIVVIITDQEAIIKFIDNGQGIKSESIVRIFEMFYRATETNVGSGLGLYIVKDVIEALNGKIEVQSIYGEGSTFTINIPNLINKGIA